ncbi:pyrroloquinoline quinone biosynthesis protein PqqE [archaeon]|nr:pyrroloquinoline quinone biosynthesis protein PqqE [archaeon]
MKLNTQANYLTKLNGPWRITFGTNPDTCNHHCIMCEEHSYYSPKNRKRMKGDSKRRLMDFSIIQKVVQECSTFGLKEIIPSTMGEPLLYKDFPGIINICHEYDVKLNLTTNGSFPGRTAEDWAELIVPVTSDVKISWNGATKELQEKVMLGSNYEQRLEDLMTLLKIRDRHYREGGNYCSVTLQLTFMEINLHEIPEIVKLAISLGADRVKGHHLWVNFNDIAQLSLRRNSDSIRRWNQTVDECRRIAKETTLPNGKHIKLDNFYKLDPYNKNELQPDGICPFLGREAWVNHEGRLDPCCAPDDLRKGLGTFGNVLDSRLMAIWESEQYNRLIKHYLENDLCQMCNMRRPREEIK